MPRYVDPAVHRRRLRAALRTARETAQRTQRDVATAMDWSLSKLIRIETGVVTITTNDLRALLAHYGVTDQATVAEMVATARSARQPSIWSAYNDVVGPNFVAYLAHESAASVIRGFEPLLVPGLLQTPDYARAVLLKESTRPDETKVQTLLELRLARQELLAAGNDRPQIFYLLDEAVIRRVVGGPSVMRQQLRYLLELIEAPDVSVLIVPFRAGIYSLLRWPSILLEFADLADANMLYIEHPERDFLVREGEHEIPELGHPSAYLEAYWEVENLALDQSPREILAGAIAALDSR
nr:helix-turn-helix transcriptional regulator [Cryptosporangium phraense]